MTGTTNARLAGFMFLFYIATAMAGTILFEKATSGKGTAAKLASIAGHAPQMRLAAVLRLVTILDALVLAVALYAIARDYDPDLAVLALSCRISEGVISAIPTIATMGLLSVATGAIGANAADAAAANALGALLLKVDVWSTIVGASVFAVGSSLYSYLFLRARSIPVPLAWLGLLASVMVAIALPAELAGFMKGALGWSMWIPMLVFEVTLGLWLLIKGVAAPQATQSLTSGERR